MDLWFPFVEILVCALAGMLIMRLDASRQYMYWEQYGGSKARCARGDKGHDTLVPRLLCHLSLAVYRILNFVEGNIFLIIFFFKKVLRGPAEFFGRY